MATYLITGGTGLIGNKLAEIIKSNGDEVRYFTRKKLNDPHAFLWDVKNQTIDLKAFDGLDYLVHLAGAGIADKRWTAKQKQEIIDSRVQSTKLLKHALENTSTLPKAIVAASAIGYYGTETKNKIYTEKDGPEKGFLSHVVQLWEQATDSFRQLNIATAQLRIGVVLSPQGGALQEMTAPPVLAVLGHGKQNVPWVHIEDLCRMIIWSLQNGKNTIYNAVAPEFTNNQTFMKTLSGYRPKILMPINAPSFVIKLMLGEMASLVLEGSPISAEKVISEGFTFKFDNLEKAFDDIYK